MLSDREMQEIYAYLTENCMNRSQCGIVAVLTSEINQQLFGYRLTNKESKELNKVVEKFVERCDNALTDYLEEKFDEYIKMNAMADNQQLYECFKNAFQNTHKFTPLCLRSALDKLVQKGVIREVPTNGYKHFQIELRRIYAGRETKSSHDELVRIYQSTDPFICTKIESEEIDINDL